MAKYTTFELREKNVVNICTAETLGKIIELEVDVTCGKITCLIVGDISIFNIFKKEYIRINWDDIRQIGDDTILVETEVHNKSCNKKRWKGREDTRNTR